MACNYLKILTVPVPLKEGPVVIRNGKTVEYQLDRTYSSDTKDSRVRRRVIGKIDPARPGRMHPNENYFLLFPNNDVPEEIRDAFMRECAIKRDMAVVKQNPEEIVSKVIQGLETIKAEGEKRTMENANKNEYIIKNTEDFNVVMHVFRSMYCYIEELAAKMPNEVMDLFKVRLINEMLIEIRACYCEENTCSFLRLIDEPVETEDAKGRKMLTGLTYSDVFMILKWYNNMPA